MTALDPRHEAAREYAARGWRVMPLHVPAGDGCSCRKGAACGTPAKHPRTIWKTKSPPSTDAAVIDQWWKSWPDSNVGVATGVPGLLVLDVDVRDGVDGFRLLAERVAEHGRLPDTAMVMTGSGRGAQFYFTAPADAPSFVITEGLEVKATGALVVAPPSRHVSSHTYEWFEDRALASAPAWLLRRASPPALVCGERLRTGRRHKAMLRLGGAMRRAGADLAEIEAALLTLNATRCDPPKDDDVVRVLADDIVKRYDPEGAR